MIDCITTDASACLTPEIWPALIGGLIGGILGVFGTLLSSYWGPRKLEEWRQQKNEERIAGPRKHLLKRLMDDPRFADGRTINTLSRVTGTTPDECRRLLIEIDARGVRLADGSEGWALIAGQPIDDQ